MTQNIVEIKTLEEKELYRNIENMGSLSQVVLDTVPEKRDEVYRAALKTATELGIDTRNLPQKYEPDVDDKLRALVSISQEKRLPSK